MNRITSLLIGIALLTGCTTGRIMVTGTTRDPISPDKVKIYSQRPDGAEEVGIVMVDSHGGGQAALDSAIKKAKEKAAAVGANGMVAHLGSTTTVYRDDIPMHKTHFTFQMLYVKGAVPEGVSR